MSILAEKAEEQTPKCMELSSWRTGIQKTSMLKKTQMTDYLLLSLPVTDSGSNAERKMQDVFPIIDP
jgi:hypothetical protein